LIEEENVGAFGGQRRPGGVVVADLGENGAGQCDGEWMVMDSESCNLSSPRVVEFRPAEEISKPGGFLTCKPMFFMILS
jgi:hypothetical protein